MFTLYTYIFHFISQISFISVGLTYQRTHIDVKEGRTLTQFRQRNSIKSRLPRALNTKRMVQLTRKPTCDEVARYFTKYSDVAKHFNIHEILELDQYGQRNFSISRIIVVSTFEIVQIILGYNYFCVFFYNNLIS